MERLSRLLPHDRAPLHNFLKHEYTTTKMSLNLVGPNGNKSTSRLFSKAAPAAFAFPQDMEVTAVEIIGILSNWLRSRDIVFRFASNGASNELMVKIANFCCNPVAEREVSNSAIFKMTSKPMRDDGYSHPDPKSGFDGAVMPNTLGWSITLHKEHNTKNENGDIWDHDNLMLTGLEPTLNGADPVRNVRFDSPAECVRHWPSVQLGDGLNLTMCVRYAKAHP